LAKEINSLWLGASKGKERGDLEKVVRNNTLLLSILKGIVESKLKTIETNELTMSSYDNPNWSHKQAHQNGLKSAYTEILKLTAFL
jgi:hypothetical protein